MTTIKCEYCGLVKAVPCRTPAEATKCDPGDEVVVRAYFAHSPADFDTPRSRQGTSAIARNLGPNTVVVDPSHPDHVKEVQLELAGTCDVIILMAMPGGAYIDSAAWRVAQAALERGGRVYELDRDANLCVAIDRIDPGRCLTSAETDRARRMLVAQRRGA
jgi:hypothetical protein